MKTTSTLIGFIAINVIALAYAFYGPPYVEVVSRHVTRFEYQLFLKSIHVVVFFFWTVAWLKMCNGYLSRLPLFIILLTPPAAAVISEILQFKIPGHRVQISGALASLVGVILAFVWLYVRDFPIAQTKRV